MSDLKRIVILGGGVGGLDAAIHIKHKNADVLVIDRNPVHVWKPSLHNFASGLSPIKENTYDFTHLARKFGFSFIQGNLKKIERDKKILYTEEGHEVPYDILITSIGAQVNDFGTKGAAENCLFLNNIYDAQSVNEIFKEKLNQARLTNNPLKTIIIGGGATGVQLMASFCQAIDKAIGFGPLERYKIFTPTLIEASPRILAPFPEKVSIEATKQLQKIGVNVLTSAMVSEVKKESVILKDGTKIEADFIIWAAGVKAPQATQLFDGLELGRGGQLIVNNIMQTSDENIFAIGDCSFIKDSPLPPTAQVARQEGIYIGQHVIHNILEKKSIPALKYRDKGAIVTTARYNGWAVFNYKKNKEIILGNGGVEAFIAELLQDGLYRRHQLTLSGFFQTTIGLSHFLFPSPPNLRPQLNNGTNNPS